MTKPSNKARSKLVEKLMLCLPAKLGDELVGERISEERRRRGISPQQLADGICAPVHIRRIEAGERRPGHQILLLISDRLAVNPVYLAWGYEPLYMDREMKEAVRMIIRLDEPRLMDMQRFAVGSYFSRPKED